jgi:hypothetical protein
LPLKPRRAGKVHLKHRLGNRKLYDGITTSPTQSWPE